MQTAPGEKKMAANTGHGGSVASPAMVIALGCGRESTAPSRRVQERLAATFERGHDLGQRPLRVEARFVFVTSSEKTDLIPKN
jgi:hypothetical protein